MKTFSKGFLAAFLGAFLFASCEPFSTSFTPTEDLGLAVSKITIKDENSVMNGKTVNLYGSKGTTFKTLSASASPSFASDTTIYWSSSDENVCSLSAETGSSVELILEGEGSATVSAKDSSGNVSAQCSVVCSFEKTPPVEVSGINAVANANNVFFTWTDPADYDSDLNYIKITSSGGQSAVIPAGVEYGWVKGLNSSTEYTFTFISVDLNGNTSNQVTTTATTLETAEEFTATEVNAPSITEKTAVEFNLEWEANGVLADSETWNHIDISVEGTDSFNSTIFYTADAIKVPFENLTENTSYKVNVCVYNDDFDVLEWEQTITTDSYVASLSLDSSVTKDVSGYIAVSLSDVSSSISYSSIKFVIDGGAGSVSGTDTSAEWTGLSLDTDYTIYAQFLDSADSVVGTSNSITKQPVKVLWHLLSGYSSGRYVCRNICSDVPEGYTVGAITQGLSTQEYWIVHSALSGTDGYYSLEATDSTGTSTGYYMYLDTTGRAQDTGTNLWTSSVGYTNKLQVASLSESYITSGRKDASFKLGSSTVKTGSGWYRFYDENLGYYLVHASLAFGGVSASTSEDSAGCAAIYIESPIYINNN